MRGAEYRLRKKSFFAGASGEVCLPHNPFPWEKPNAFSLFGASGPFTGAKPPVCRKDFSPNQGPAAAELSARFARSTRKEGDKSPPFHTFSPMYPITPSLGKTQHIFSFRGRRPFYRGKAPIKRNLCLFLSLFLWGGWQRMAANGSEWVPLAAMDHGGRDIYIGTEAARSFLKNSLTNREKPVIMSHENKAEPRSVLTCPPAARHGQ